MGAITITRQLELDAGHRIPDHKSKCFNLHGHRYKLLATCEGPLKEYGSERGMVKDFSVVKEAMNVVHDMFDHRTILFKNDPFLSLGLEISYGDIIHDCLMAEDKIGNRYVLIEDVPTAENLCVLWGRIVADRLQRTDQEVQLVKFTVYETPNCYAEVYFK